MEADDKVWAKAFHENFKITALNPRQQALCDYAEKLTLTPKDMTEADLTPLRQQGLDDKSILDLVQIVGYFNYINRVADALGIPPEPDWAD